MRFVLCDDDRVMCSMLDSVVVSCGHEVVGIADVTANAHNLILAARPDVVIVDLSLGYSTDFDILDVVAEVGARAIVFSTHGDLKLSSRAGVQPAVVLDRDFVALEQVIRELAYRVDEQVRPQDRRRRPVTATAEATPTGVSDASDFYRALNEAVEGDAFVSIELPIGANGSVDGVALAPFVLWQLRQSDRLLGSGSSVRIYLASAGIEGADAVLQRLHDAVDLPAGALLRAVVVQRGEAAADAFDRLKHGEDSSLRT